MIMNYKAKSKKRKIIAGVLCLGVVVCFVAVPVKKVVAREQNNIVDANGNSDKETLTGKGENNGQKIVAEQNETEGKDATSQIKDEDISTPELPDEAGNLTFDFVSCSVEPRWYVYDGLTLQMSYDVIQKGEEQAEVMVSSTLGETNYNFSNASGNRRVMQAIIASAVFHPVTEVEFSVSGDENEKTYTVPIKITQGEMVVSEELNERLQLQSEINSDDGPSVMLVWVNLTHIDLTKNALGLTLESGQFTNDIFDKEWKIEAKMKNNFTKTLVSHQFPLVAKSESISFIRFSFEEIDPKQIKEIRFSSGDGDSFSISMD